MPVDPYKCSTAHIVVAWVLTGLTLGILLPWAIAATRGHKDVVPIALINFLLCWTGVAWIICLIWACITPQAQVQQRLLVNQMYGYGYGFAPTATAYQQYPMLSAGAAPVYPQLPAQPYSQSLAPIGMPVSQASASPYGWDQVTQPLPTSAPSAQQWQPAPWDRPTPGTHG